MLQFKYAIAGAAVLALSAVPAAAQPEGCQLEAFNFASGTEALGFSTILGQSATQGIGGFGFRHGGGRRERLSHKCPKGRKRVFLATDFGFTELEETGAPVLSWDFGTSFDNGAYSVTGEVFAGERLTFSGNAGSYRDRDETRLTGINNDGISVSGGVTAYATKNFALDASVDYMSSTLYGGSSNVRFGAEFLPVAGVPLSLYGGYDRTDFNTGGVYGLFSLGFTAYLGGEAKGDLRSYHRGQ